MITTANLEVTGQQSLPKTFLRLLRQLIVPITCLVVLPLMYGQQTPNGAPTSIFVPCGGDLQTIINTAAGGTTILVAHLQADGVTRCQWGSYGLPWRPDNGVVTISTDGKVPANGTRTQPGDSYLALFTANCSVAQGYYQVFFPAWFPPTTTPGHPPHGYSFVGLELTAPNDTACSSYGLVTLGAYTPGTITFADLPYQFTFSHDYIHGANADQEIGRGISMVGDLLTVLDSTISEIHSTYIESNTIYGCTMHGNWTIINNDLQAASENILICGSEGQIAMPSPQNITIRYNYIHKNPAWRFYVTGSGGSYIMKNLLELKSADGSVIDSNVLEYSWQQSQQGYAVVFTPRYLGDGLHSVRNIQFTNNTVRHTAMGISLGLYDDSTCPVLYPYNTCLEAGGGSQNFFFQNNLFDDMSGTTWGFGESSYGVSAVAFTNTVSRYFTRYFTYDHNTINAGANTNINSCSYQYNLFGGGPWPPGESANTVQITNNVMPWPMCRDGATGPPAVLPGSIFSSNSMAISFTPQSAWTSSWPNGNYVDGRATTDGRGANLSQLSSLEAMVKSGSVCAADVSSQVSVSRGGWHYSYGTNTYTETLTLTNRGNSTLSSLSVGILGLSNFATLNSASGTTFCGSSPGAPYQNTPNPALTLAPGQSVSLNLTMGSSIVQTIGFNTQVLAGLGLR
jgi:hypothetical protein